VLVSIQNNQSMSRRSQFISSLSRHRVTQATPASQSQYQVEFSALRRGVFHSRMQAFSPGIPNLPIAVSAHVGDVLHFDCSRDLHFAPVAVGGFLVFSIPLTNVANSIAEFLGSLQLIEHFSTIHHSLSHFCLAADAVEGLAGFPLYFRLRTPTARKSLEWSASGIREADAFRDIRGSSPTVGAFEMFETLFFNLLA